MESFPVSFSHAAFFASTPSPHPRPPPRPPPGVLGRRGRGGCPRGGKGRAPSRRVPGGERSGAGRSGRGGGEVRGRRLRRGREGRGSRLLTPSAERINTGGNRGEEKRERRSPGLRGGGECLAARGSGGGGPPCVTFNRSLLCQRQQRQEGLATESGETAISCVESSRQSESFLGLSLLSGLVYMHACVCVCLPVYLRGVPVPGLCIPNIATPPRLDTPPPPRPPAKIKTRCYLGIGHRQARSSPPPLGPARPAEPRPRCAHGWEAETHLAGN